LKGSYMISHKPNDLYFDLLSGKDEIDDGLLYKFNFFPNDRGKFFIMHYYDDNSTSLWFRVKDIYSIDVGNLFTEVSNISTEIKNSFNIELTDEQKNTVSRLC